MLLEVTGLLITSVREIEQRPNPSQQVLAAQVHVRDMTTTIDQDGERDRSHIDRSMIESQGLGSDVGQLVVDLFGSLDIPSQLLP